MKTSSAKAKGRRLQQYVAKQIGELLGIDVGKDELIQSREMSQSGTDIKLIGEAKKRLPLAIECKNCQSWSIPAWIEQAKKNTEENQDWLLVCSKNRYNPIAILDFEVFMKILKRSLNNGKFGKK